MFRNRASRHTGQAADALLEQLGSKNVQRSVAAEQTLRHIGPQIVEVLLEHLREEARRSKKRRAALAGVPFLLSAMVFTGVMAGTRSLTHGFVYGLWSGVAAFHYLWATARFKTLIAGKTAGVLAKYDDLRAVGPLVDALHCPEPDVGMLARQALTRLLPRLQHADSALLDEPRYLSLCHALRFPDSDFVAAALKAIAQIGDARALPTVRRLAASSGRAPRQETIRTAARECLTTLEARLERERPGQNLLRPASPPLDTLPRPVKSAVAPNPERLLRPSDKTRVER